MTTTARSSQPTVRNPILALPAARKLAAMPQDQREALREILMDLCNDAAGRAQTSWSRGKAPLAAYWKAVSVYARHTARALRKPPQADTPPAEAPATGPEPVALVALIDDNGRHVISLLSGHIGGANALARTVADFIGATAVITTATDVNQLPAIDVIAGELGLDQCFIYAVHARD